MTGKKRTKPYHQYIPYWWITLGFSALFFVIFSTAFFSSKYGERLVSEVLSDIVKTESNGTYQLSFKSLRLNLFKREIHIEDVELRPLLRKNGEVKDKFGNNYSVTIPTASLSLFSVSDIFIDRRLNVRELLLNRPLIKVKHKPEKKKKLAISSNTGDLYEIISGYIKSYKVKDFGITNGQLDYSVIDSLNSRLYKINDFSFHIDNFELDSTSSGNENKIFYTDNIRFSLRDERVRLPDNIHYLSFDSLIISTKESSVAFYNIKLKPSENLDPDLYEKLVTLNNYDFFIPTFKITGLNFSKAYQENTLIIEDILLDDSQLSTDLKMKGSNKTEDKRAFLYFVKGLFDEININNMNISNGFLQANLFSKNWKGAFRTDSINILIENVKIDSLGRIISKGDSFYEDFEIRLSNYRLKFPDSIHVLTAKSLLLSTKQQLIEADSIIIEPNSLTKSYLNKVNPSGTLISFRSPKMRFDGTDIRYAIMNDNIIGNTFSVQGGKLVIYEPLVKNTADKNMLDIIKDSGFNLIDITEIDLKNVDLKVVNRGDFRTKHALKNTNLSIKNFDFRKDSITGITELFVKPEIEVDISDYTMNLDDYKITISGENLLISNEREQLSTNFFSLIQIPGESSDSISLKFKTLILSDLNFDSLLLTNQLYVGELICSQPHFTLMENPTGGTGTAQPIFNYWKIDSLRVEDAQIHYRSAGQQFEIEGLNLQAKNIYQQDSSENRHFPFRLSNVHIEGNSFEQSQPDGDSKFSLSRFVFERNNLTIHSIKLVMNTSKGHFEWLGDSLSITEFSLDNLMKENSISIGTALIASSTFRAQKISIPQTAVNSNHSPIITPFEKIKVDQLSMPSIYLELDTQDSTALNFWKSQLALQISGVNSEGKFQLKELLKNVDDLRLNLANNEIGLPQLNDTIPIKLIRLAMKGGLIGIFGVELNENWWLQNENNAFTVGAFMDSTIIKGFDFPSFIDEQSIKFKSLSTYLPSIRVDMEQIPAANDNDNNANMRLPVLYAGEISLYTDQLLVNAGQDYNLSKVRLSLHEVRNESNGSTIKDVNYHTSLSLNGIEYAFHENTLLLGIEELKVDSRDSTIFMGKPTITPLFGKFELAGEIGHQTDWINLDTKEVMLTGVDVFKLLHDQDLEAEKIVINKPRLEVFRDKRIPRDSTISFKPDPVERLLKLPYHVAIDEIELYDGFISYSEMVEDGLRPGEIFFEDLNATFYNVNNVDSIIGQRPILRLKAVTTLLGESYLVSEFIFELNKPGYHYYNVEVESMNLEALNAIFEYTEFIKVKSGRMNRMQMNVQANPNFSTGEMFFYYDDLKINFINKKNYSTKGVGKAMEDFFANTFVNSSNPAFLHNRRGEIFFERDSTKSIFNYWAKSTLSGVVSSVGLNKNRKELRRIRKGKPVF